METSKFFIKTLGCKLNFTESSSISAFLLENKISHCSDRNNADIFILNTCSVTGTAEKKCIQEIRYLHKINPNAPIIVTGCFANLDSDKLKKEKNVFVVSGRNIQHKKESILQLIQNKSEISNCDYNDNFSLVWSSTRTRCFLKIQDGCDNKCSYCTVHLARGNSRSATIKEVCKSILEISKTEVNEIVLTGLNTADFGRINNENFIDLLLEIENLNCLNRFRISSIEPNLLTEEIILFVKNSKCFLPHFHIPLQSGCNSVLKLMGRNYLTFHFKKIIEQIKYHIPEAFIGIDIIAGMNGETEQNFIDSYNFVKDLPISYIHAFPYSERPNTKAIGFLPIVILKDKHERIKMYISLSDSKLKCFYENNVGKIFNVLFEDKSNDGYFNGFTENYIKTKVYSDKNIKNKIIPILLTDIDLADMKMKGVFTNN